MNKEFKFPPDAPPPPPRPRQMNEEEEEDDEPQDRIRSVPAHTTSSSNIPDKVTPVELPPPTPVEKDDQILGRADSRLEHDQDPDEDVGETVEVDLS